MTTTSSSSRKPVFGQTSSLGVAVILERLAWAEAILSTRLLTYANRRKSVEMTITADLVALVQLRLIYLLRPAVVVSLRPYHQRNHGRNDPIMLKRVLSVRGWRKKYPKLLRKD